MIKAISHRSTFCLKIIVFILLGIISVKAQEQYFIDETDQRMPRIGYICSVADAADIDLDGDLDIIGDAWAALPPYNPYYLFINNGNGVFTDETEERLPDTFFYSAAVGFGDIETDGDYDAYIVSEHYQDFLYLNDGFGYFSDETSQRLPPLMCDHSNFVFGDFSGDACWDIITICIGYYGNSLSHYLLNNCLGYFEDVTDERMPPDTIDFDTFGAGADLDNDLDLDLLLAWYDGTYTHIRGLENCEGYFTNFEENILEDRRSRWIVTADVDNDLDLDIVISGVSSLGILINNNGIFIDETDERVPYIDEAVNMIGLGDYDNDGDIDMYGGYSVGIRDHFFINDGDGYFELADERIPGTRTYAWWIEPFDADSDGDLDIYLACVASGQQRILINHSTPDTIVPRILAEDLPLGVVDSAAQYWVKVSTYDNISVEKGALSVDIYYRVDEGDFVIENFVHCGGTIYSYAIPGQAPGSVVEYYIEIKDKMNNFITSPPNVPDSLYSFIISPPTKIKEDEILVSAGGLRIHPNPSNSTFSVTYFAESDRDVTITVYDLIGRKLYWEVLNPTAVKEWQKWYWSGWSDLSSGIYFIELSGNTRKEVKKAVLIR